VPEAGPESASQTSAPAETWRPAAPPESPPVSAPEPPSLDSGSTDSAAIAEIGAKVASEMEPPPATGDREDQMAAIRQMLSDLKENAEEAPEPEPEEDPAPIVEPAPEPSEEDLEYERDSLKSRIDGANKKSRAIKGEAADSGYDSAKLRRLHEKRAKKLQRARERRKKSGAFVTGFTLVSVVAVTLVGLYVLQPQIVNMSPKMAPALNEYVVTVDRYRVQLNEATAEWRQWLTERIGKLSDDG
jgi:hypothetical protein